MARVLVTGAGGFIGRNLVKHLVERGDSVRCLIYRRGLSIPDAEAVPGDITVPQSLDRVIEGMDVVYHLAGATVVVSTQQYRRVNSLGTRNLAQACTRMAKPPVLVFLSSLAAAGPTAPNQPRREEDRPTPVSAYGRSKLAAERYLRQLADQLPVTVLRSPGVIGPGDPNLIKLFKIARFGINIIPGDIGQQLALIYVDDLVEALTQAAERGERLRYPARRDDPAGVYFVAMEERPSLAELGELAGRVLNQARVRTLTVPAWLGMMLGRFNDFRARLLLHPYMLNSDKMREALAGSWICSSAKARRHWGFASRTGLTDGLHKSAAWYRQHGWL